MFCISRTDNESECVRFLAFAGSITFVSGNLPGRTEVVPSLIVYQLEEHHFTEATAIAAVLLIFSFIILATINWLEVRARRYAN